jgi:hypothetical protein
LRNLILRKLPGISKATASTKDHHQVMRTTTLESCHSIWIFDEEQMRFRRILKGIAVDDQPVTTGWRPYRRLLQDEHSEAFTVVLNEEGSRMIRSWQHTGACSQCTAQHTSQVSLADVRQAVSAAGG